MKNYASKLDEQLSFHSDLQRATRMKSYMKDLFDYHGISAPERKKILKSFVLEHGLPDNSSPKTWTKEAWNLPCREVQYCCMELLLRGKRVWPEEVIDLFEWMVVHKSWWDTVDYIAGSLVYTWSVQHADHMPDLVEKWSKSENMWLNRTAIIYQLKSKDKTDTDLMERAILPHIHSSEFFHQKAIGWALRQYGKFNPEWVLAFADQHPLKPLSRREALRIIRGK